MKHRHQNAYICQLIQADRGKCRLNSLSRSTLTSLSALLSTVHSDFSYSYSLTISSAMVVTFFRGHPSNDLLPSREVADAAVEVLGRSRDTDDDETTRHPLTYGSDEGALAVRESLAKWTNERLGGNLTADCLNLTNGASFGAASALLQCCPRDYTVAAFAVTPTYFLINTVLKDAGFEGKTFGVVEDPKKGLDLDGFEAKLKELAESHKLDKEIRPGYYRFVLYIVPTFSNPGGYTLKLAERLRLLELARLYDVLILCDEVYNLLDYDDPESRKLPMLVNLDRETVKENSWGNVIGNFTVSKYFGPGLRVGWQLATSPRLAFHLSQSGANISGGSPAHLNTFLVQELVDSGIADKIIHKLNVVYGRRAAQYRDAMKKYLPSGTEIYGAKGGYFFWLQLPAGYDVDAITADCRKQGIILAPGNHFEVDGDEKGWGKRCFRVSLSYYEYTDEVEQAFRTWGEACNLHKISN